MVLEPDDWPPLVELPDCADMLEPEVPRLPDEPAPLLAPRPLDDDEPEVPDEEPDRLLCDDEPVEPLEDPDRFDEPGWPLCDDEPDIPLCEEPDRPLCDEPDLLPCDEPEELPDSPLCCEPDEAFEPDALPEEERTSFPILVPDSRPWPLPLLPAFDF